MRKLVLALAVGLLSWSTLRAQEAFSTHFADSTLRLDYAFVGDVSHQAIYLRKMLRTPVWAGRRNHLSKPLLQGNGQIRVLDPATGECL